MRCAIAANSRTCASAGGLRGSALECGEQPRKLPAAPGVEPGAEVAVLQHARRPERVDPGSEGQGPLRRRRVAEQHQAAATDGFPRDLLEETTLAHPRFAHDDQRPAPAGDRRVERPLRGRPLAFTRDER